jgi:hypothetical protein
VDSSYDNSTALVVLPAAGGGRIGDRRLRRWLGRSELLEQALEEPLLAPVLDQIGHAVPASGLAALRLWGQTGERPKGFIAAADPVYLEPRLGTLCVYDLGPEIPAGEFHRLIGHLQERLANESSFGFESLGACGYVSSERPFTTATVAPARVHGDCPDAQLPGGAAGSTCRRLVSEIEMALHEHEVNREREAGGHQPVNSLWVWGGGLAPAPSALPLPPLYADDPLLRGYWYAATGNGAAWPGSIGACLDATSGGFVAVVPQADDPPLLESLLAELRAALRAGRLARLSLRFRDGLHAEVLRAHRRRVWRRQNALLDARATSA